MKNGIAIAALSLTIAGCGAGKLATDYPSTSSGYTYFTGANGTRFMAAPSKVPGKFIISLPQGDQFAAGMTFGAALPKTETFRAGADEYVKTLGPNCRITAFEAVMGPAHEATFTCSQTE